ncbi:hypothetical protein [Mycoplasma sp. 3686d]|uniref:hypothetical protein n=1 Tax=Mycoplasma sp. 3686d TaxID=2967300 RepID=UPI00211BA936|nr:hypothetical protein [Mycoplasma sp. 3686d]UUM24549.1 hypothetical protein NPA12_02505 [Mycoplasma sp. 3686d]
MTKIKTKRIKYLKSIGIDTDDIELAIDEHQEYYDWELTKAFDYLLENKQIPLDIFATSLIILFLKPEQAKNVYDVLRGCFNCDAIEIVHYKSVYSNISDLVFEFLENEGFYTGSQIKKMIEEDIEENGLDNTQYKYLLSKLKTLNDNEYYRVEPEYEELESLDLEVIQTHVLEYIAHGFDDDIEEENIKQLNLLLKEYKDLIKEYQDEEEDEEEDEED